MENLKNDKKKMNILVVCQYFSPEGFRINEICRALVAMGHNVTVLTGTPNYPEGKIYKGYERGKRAHEFVDGSEVYRAKIIRRANGNAVRMVLNYYSFVVSGSILALKLAKKKKFDQVYVYQTSPALMAIPALKLAKKQKIPMTMNILDMWPDSVYEVGKVKNKLIINYLNRRLQKIYDTCSKIFVSSRAFKKILIERKCCDENKIIYWPQYPDDICRPVSKKKDTDKFVIMFTGNVGKTQGLDIVVKCAKYIKDNNLSDKIKWIIVGDGRGKKDIEKLIAELGVEDSVLLHDRVPVTEIPDMLAKADAAYICLRVLNISNITLPAKVQSYMACGKPVIGSINGEGANVIKEAECGLVSEAGNVEALAENAIKMSEMSEEELSIMGKNALEYCKKEFNKEELMNLFEEELLKLM